MSSKVASTWASWVKDIKVAHPDEYLAFKAEHPEMMSHVIAFAKAWKDTHPEEYATYVESVRPVENMHTSIKKFGKVAKAKMAHGGAAGAGTPEPDIHRIAHELHSLASELESMSGGAYNKTRCNQKKRRTTRRR